VGPDRSAPPGTWRVVRAILPLPFAATVLVPAIIVVGDGSSWDLAAGARAATIAVAGVLIGIGLSLFSSTVRLFASVGRGTLAPWDPPKRLVIRGPYRFLRHPMIAGVALVLAGEALALGSASIAIWLASFIAVNAVYLPLVEEPALLRRFGADYEHYMANVGRWLPRLRPWDSGSGGGEK
jgi:protein-S-isoprenylcysteine O-methyltransferase Ste14